MILLNPGPVTLTQRVKRALAGEDLCHREAEFADLTLNVLRGIEGVYDTAGDYGAVMLSGSGTAAVEAMLSTFASRTRPTLVVCNGVYGERMAAMLARQGKPHVALKHEWLSAIDLSRVEQALGAEPGIANVAVVHNETTTGRLNDLAPLAALCGKRGLGLLVDAVSSFGGELLDFSKLKPLAVAATANKCLHGAPGISFVLARKTALDAGESQATTLYLDLLEYYREQRKGWSPYTQAVHVTLALREALRELADAGGVTARQKLYLDRSTTVRRTLAGLGIETLVPVADCSSMLTGFKLPEGESYDRLHDSLKAQGYVIYAGQGAFNGRIFRIATMGEIPAPELDRLCNAFREHFAKAEAR
ncbi:MAG TPA: aminotransferase class V-fold PLP-dependent enzyme [Burkholderiales bacterium]|nr:aminotransferase class V-fold PLP-dependent enzyme [Burkholderiales bacterium]